MKTMKWLVLVATLTGLLVACGDVAGDPADVVERYLQAKVTGDAEVVGQLLCSEMESDLPREVASFGGVSDPRIDNLACTLGENDLVSCEGTIVATYGTSEEEIPLSSYRVVQDDGEWRWCGEGE